jgi:hypothetical protein
LNKTDSKGKIVAKAKKSDTSDDQDTKPTTEVAEDVVDAEVIEEIPAESTDDTEIDEPETDEIKSEDGEEASSDDQVSSDEATVEENLEDTEAEEPLTESETDPNEPVAENTQSEPTSVAAASGFVPLLVGGILAGGIGFGAALLLDPLQSGPDEATIALQSDVQSQAAVIETLTATVENNANVLGQTSEDAGTLQASIDGLTASLAATNQKFDDVSGALADLDARIIELEKRPFTQGLPSSAIQAYERELEELKASVAAQRAEAEAMEENAKLTAQQALARAALTRVLSALDAGQSFRAPLTDLVSATGTPAPAELEALADIGAPSLASLQSRFPDAARAALAAARRTEGQGGNRLLSFMQTQLGARSVTPQEGDDADAVLSRAEAALTAGNLTNALAEISALPEVAQAEIAEWFALARTRQEALAAGEALSQALNTN